MKNLIRISAAFGLLIMLCSVALSQSKTPITREEIVGEYSMGHSFFGSNLRLENDGTFKVFWGSDTVQGAHNGTYAFDGINLSLTWNSSTEMIGGTPIQEESKPTNKESIIRTEKLVVTRWDTRMYLIPQGEFLFFCNLVNAGIEPRTEMNSSLGEYFSYGGHYSIRLYLKDDGKAPIPRGLPEVPLEFRQYLLTTPITGKITKVENISKDTFADIFISNRKGLKIGMTLVARPDRFISDALEVIEIKGSIVKVRAYTEIKVGDKVSTRFSNADMFLRTTNK